jgi:hypothetical protein
MFRDLEWTPYGFIIPNTRTYMCVGSIGGLTSKHKYKGLNDFGNRGGGPICEDPNDWYPYYWLYDLREIIDSVNGNINEYEIWPYEYGELSMLPATMFPQTHTAASPPPWRTPYSATFDATTNKLYLLTGSNPELTNSGLITVIQITAFP